MEIIKKFIFLSILGYCNVVNAQAPQGGHGGHGGGSGGTDEISCVKARISHYKPEHLATVAPGSEFSFTVSGSNGPGHIHVNIRQQPVKMEIEDKETFYILKGKLPTELKNETVRISVKAKAKFSKCDAESGILLKISE